MAAAAVAQRHTSHLLTETSAYMAAILNPGDQFTGLHTCPHWTGTFDQIKIWFVADYNKNNNDNNSNSMTKCLQADKHGEAN